MRANITSSNPSGCMHDLYAWTAVTVGWGDSAENAPPLLPFTDQSTFQGGVSMGFYNNEFRSKKSDGIDRMACLQGR